MRSSLLSVVLQMTSSRQSPRTSAQRQGVDFEELFEEQFSAVTRLVSRLSCQSHLVILLPLRSSRSRSPSHQTPKLHDRGFRWEIGSPLTSQRPVKPRPAAHISYPRCRGSMSNATPRTTSGEGFPQIKAPVLASRNSA